MQRAGLPRTDLLGVIEPDNRFVETFLLLQQLTETAPAVDGIRREHEAAIKALDRLVEATLMLECAREVEEIIRRVRVLADRAGEPFDGKIYPLRKQAQHAHQVQRIGVSVVERERARPALLRFGKLPGLQETESDLEPGSRCLPTRPGRGFGLPGAGSLLLAVHRRPAGVDQRRAVNDSRSAGKSCRRSKARHGLERQRLEPAEAAFTA